MSDQAGLSLLNSTEMQMRFCKMEAEKIKQEAREKCTAISAQCPNLVIRLRLKIEFSDGRSDSDTVEDVLRTMLNTKPMREEK